MFLRFVVVPALLLFGASPVAFGQNAVEHYEAGETALSENEYTVAVQRFRDALDINESYKEAWAGLARAYRELDELQEALDAVVEARRLAREDTAIITLEGNIRLLRGDVQQARESFERALDIEPNNVEARLGIAELNLADDRRERAVDAYLDVLEVDPESRPALLSLAVLYDDLGEQEAASRYISMALEYYPRDEMVHEFAGDFFLASQEVESARDHAETAVTLNPEYGRGWDLLSRTALRQDDTDRAVASAQRLVDLQPDRSRSWYLLGLAERASDEYEDAVESLERATELNPDDEVSRLAVESAVSAGFGLEEEIRERIAAYRFERGDSLAEENLFIQAVAEYRRGLSLYPFSRDGRYDLAVLQQRRGFPAKFLEELRVLDSIGFDDQEVSDGISTYESVLADGVAASWDVEQFQLSRDRVTFGLFFSTPPQAGTRPEAARYVTEYMRHRLLGAEKINVSEAIEPAGSSDDAFGEARDAGVDYYLITTFSEMERSIELGVELRHGATGSLIAELTAVRSGAQRVRRAVAALSENIEEEIPARGRLVQRRADRAVINLGKVDGVEAGDELLIVRQGRFATAADRVGYEYDEDDLVGRIEITEAGDLIAEGEVSTEGFFDLVETGDTILQPLEGRVETFEDRPAFSPLYFRIREVRGQSQN
ncbi:MAG: tetratricopeptide repeat protein [Spirochaetota bacterium]